MRVLFTIMISLAFLLGSVSAMAEESGKKGPSDKACERASDQSKFKQEEVKPEKEKQSEIEEAVETEDDSEKKPDKEKNNEADEESKQEKVKKEKKD